MNALPIRPIAETADSVTLSRADFETLAELVSDAQDLANADAVKARLAAGETETFPFAVAERLLDGEHPVTVLREHRAFTVRGLAEAAGVSPSYLSEIDWARNRGASTRWRALPQRFMCRWTFWYGRDRSCTGSGGTPSLRPSRQFFVGGSLWRAAPPGRIDPAA